MRITKHSLAGNTPYSTPYYVVESKRPGPVVMITAGVHGNEVGSILAAKKLIEQLQNHEVSIRSGTLVLVPVVNQQAYRKRIRGKPDLNRTFPTKAGGTAAHPLSQALLRLAKRYKPSWVLDLHEANGYSNVNKRVLGQSLLTHKQSQAMRAVQQVKRHLNRSIKGRTRKFTIIKRHKQGSFRTAAAKLLRCRAVTVETSWEMPLSTRIQYQRRIVACFMEKAGIQITE